MEAASFFVSFCSLIVALIALGLSFYSWRRSFRPIVTAAVKTHAGGNVLTAYNLVVMNSGTLPAKNIRLSADKNLLARALGRGATEKERKSELACFDSVIRFLQNNDRVSCAFGHTKANDAGFWKYNAIISIDVNYEGWFGSKYHHTQELVIVDSESFTGYFWGDP
jgi:hypothetical protein